MIELAAVGLAAVLVTALAAWLLMRRRDLRGLVGERVVLQTKDDRSLRGVLTAVHRDCLAVGHFTYLDEADPADLPGEAAVRFDNLSWIHRLGPGD